MFDRRHPWWPFVVILIFSSLVIVACGDLVGVVEERATAQSQTGAQETVDQATPTSKPTLTPTVEIRPTDTPALSPPTPTSLPTNTPSPTPEPAQAGEAGEDKDIVTLTSTPTLASQITEVMVEIPGGEFTLGNDNGEPNEGPAQQSFLDTFLMDAFEVNNADFAAFVEATGYVTFREREGSPQSWRTAFAEGKERHPVVFVTFDDAQAFCEWVGKRLPTEFEWEKAARGPDNFLYPWGNEYDSVAFNGKESGVRGTVVGGSYPANPYGLFDMAGNVREWVASPYVAYPNSTYQDKFYSETYRGIRGGGWFDEGEFVSATNRNSGDPKITANDDIGFRCAKDKS